MRYLLVLAFLSFYAVAFSQIEVSSKFINQDSGAPVEYASVFLLKDKAVGSSTGNSGYFKLWIPKCHVTDTVVISCVGYERKEVTVEYITQNKTIFLQPKEEQIDEVIISNNLSAQKIVKIALRKYPKWCFKYRYSTDFSMRSYLFVDSTKLVVGAMETTGVMNNNGMYNDSLEEKVSVSKYQVYGSVDTSYFTPSMCIKNKHYDATLNLEYRVIDHFAVFWHVDPITAQYFYPDMKGHFNFIDDSTKSDKFWIVSVTDLRHIDYGYKLPEEQFRKQYKKDLNRFKQEKNYSPTNKLFVLSEAQVDSLFYSDLRKRLEKGNPMFHNMILYIDKSTFAIHKAEYRFSGVGADGKFSVFTNFTVDYGYLLKKKKLTPLKIEIVTKSSMGKFSNHTVFDFTNINTGKGLNRISSKDVHDRGKPNSVTFLDITSLDVEGWAQVNGSNIFKPAFRTDD
ncbi:carboxypeptidase-like regulatory domain-containing protein [Williamwhitmania taraxaci]|uniref:CarboxypepD_reg-like domain-containing protein n=1 Tax=Williamwhitmania taraxaci TaxID=1640674 RepID=A0A1G6SI61_9BACT|nr:carboxypeptidase-like regulatory domain-containing protein [Williamwhitmania taraxaci]SDD15836.1 CarboxypepD_reg-like domain-containing protein [Williamwhitmania taraxaci]